MASDIKFKIDNLTDNEHMIMYPFLSRDNLTRAQEVKFFNSDKPLRFFTQGKPPGGSEDDDFITSTVIYEDQLARLVYEYKRIEMLSDLIAKTNIALQGYFAQTTDTLGSTVINAMDRLINYAEDSLNTDIVKETASDAINEERSFIDRYNSPCMSWASKKLNSFAEDFIIDLHLFNRKLYRNRTLNISGDSLFSVRHITYKTLNELERLVYYTHEFFVDMRELIISLKQTVIGVVSATRVYLISDHFTILTPPGYVSAVGGATAEVVSVVEDYINSFIRFTNLKQVASQIISGDISLLDDIETIAKNTEKFVGNGVRPYMRKYLIKESTETLLQSLYDYSIRFSLSTAYHYRPYVNNLRIMPFIVFKRVLPDSYYPSYVMPKSITVDIYGNKLKYLDAIKPLLFKKRGETDQENLQEQNQAQK